MSLFSDTQYQNEVLGNLVESIKTARNGNLLSFYGTSTERLLGNIANKQYLQAYEPDYDWDKHIILFYDCDDGQEFFERKLSANMSLYYKEEDLLRQVFRAIADKKIVSLLIANFNFEQKIIRDLTNLIGGMDRRFTHFIVHMQPGDYYSGPKIKYANSTVLSHNIVRLPYLSEEDASAWIDSLVKKHGFKVSKKTKQQIISFSGGIPSLIRNIVREAQTQDFEEVINSEPVVNLINIIWQKLTDQERTELERVNFSSKRLVKSFEYFNDFRVTENGLYKAGWLSKIIYPIADSQDLTLDDNNKLVLLGKEIDSILSVQEQLLVKLLVLTRGARVSRNEIISRVWGDELENPDWALNQLVARTRGKLSLLGLPSDLIRVSRGYGYILK